MDKFAKEIAQAHIRRPQERQYVQTTLGIGSIVCRGQVVTTRVQKSLNDEISHGDMMGLLGDILGLEGQFVDSVVSWPSYHQARKMVG